MQPARKPRGLLILGATAAIAILAGGAWLATHSDDNAENADPTALAVREPQPIARRASPIEQNAELAETTPESTTATAPTPGERMQPGLWRFDTEMYDVTSTNLGNPANDISKFPIRRYAGTETCFTPGKSAIPVAIALPASAAQDCRMTDVSTADGEYRASLVCTGSRAAQPTQVELGGTYRSDSADLTMHSTVMASQIATGAVTEEPVVAHTAITAARLGPCPG